MKRILIIVFLLYSSAYDVSAQELTRYKQVDTTELFLEVYYPEKAGREEPLPAMIFFFGGGWKNGNRQHFLNHAKYFAERGLVCFLADYRIESKHGTSPIECLKDAKSAIRYIRQNADDFGIDPGRIIASGGSAGGHLAAATALIEKFNDSSDNMNVSCIPQALVLFNPVLDNGPGGYGNDRIGGQYKDFSPLHNIRKGAPPAIIFLGTEDRLIPVATAEYFQVVMERVGSRCELKLYEGAGHGFFNYRNRDYYHKTVTEADAFLTSLGYLR